MRGNGTRLVVISFKSTFKEPSKRMELVRFVITFAAISFIESNGFASLAVLVFVRELRLSTVLLGYATRTENEPHTNQKWPHVTMP
jgi:hypothetical protein